MATLLQLLKETGVRCGEAGQPQWTEADTINCSIRVTPEKGSNARNLRSALVCPEIPNVYV